MNSKLHVVCDSRGRPIQMYLSAGQTSDYVGAAGLLRSMPRVNCLLADRGYDADWFRSALIDMDITPCIPSKKNRKVHIPHDAALYKKRHNLLGHANMPCQATDRKYVRTPEGLAKGRHAI